MCNELVISYFFPPSKNVTGMGLSKKLINENKHVDVLHAVDNKNLDLEFGKYIDEIVNNQILINIDCDANYPKCIFKFIKKGLNEINKEYDTITSIVWPITNHFLALEYKFKNRNVFWNAEFSDPIIYDTHNHKRERQLNDETYINHINKELKRFNEKNNTDFDLIDNPTDMFYLTEYLTFIFADNIIFNNENQREIMLNNFDNKIKVFVLNKSEIKHHTPLPKKYYHIKEYDEDLNENMINIGYFGNYYSKRHFEGIFSAFEVLNHKYKSKIQFYFYTNQKKIFKKIIEDLEISNNITIKNTVDYLDFLNLIIKFDVLIVNDLITKDSYDINPYIPSKFYDYKQSESDIWAICEENSALSRKKVEYKSNVHDYKSNCNVFVKILHDHGFDDKNYSIDNMNEYYEKRITDLNKIIESQYHEQLNCENKIKKLKSSSKNEKKNNGVKSKIKNIIQR